MQALEPVHIAAKYGVDPSTFRKWVNTPRHAKIIGPRIGNKYTPLQVVIIQQIFGDFPYPNARASTGEEKIILQNKGKQGESN